MSRSFFVSVTSFMYSSMLFSRSARDVRAARGLALALALRLGVEVGDHRLREAAARAPRVPVEGLELVGVRHEPREELLPPATAECLRIRLARAIQPLHLARLANRPRSPLAAECEGLERRDLGAAVAVGEGDCPPQPLRGTSLLERRSAGRAAVPFGGRSMYTGYGTPNGRRNRSHHGTLPNYTLAG